MSETDSVHVDVRELATTAEPRPRRCPAPPAPPALFHAASAPPTTVSSPSSWPSTPKLTGRSAWARSSSCQETGLPATKSRAASSALCRDGQLDRIRSPASTSGYKGQRTAARHIPAARRTPPELLPEPRPAGPPRAPGPASRTAARLRLPAGPVPPAFPRRRPDDRRAVR